MKIIDLYYPINLKHFDSIYLLINNCFILNNLSPIWNFYKKAFFISYSLCCCQVVKDDGYCDYGFVYDYVYDHDRDDEYDHDHGDHDLLLMSKIF